MCRATLLREIRVIGCGLPESVPEPDHRTRVGKIPIGVEP